MKPTLNIFKQGATWIRADFHLHTRSDSEFLYKGNPDFFSSEYINQLAKQDIRLGVVTNHNKFALDEFKELQKNALKKEICLLPGLEFSVKDGAKGLHVLIVFDNSWIQNQEKKNYIQDFLTSAFIGIKDYDRSPYKNSKFTFEETCDALDEFGKDYFIVLAHVDDSSGLFDELDKRGLEDFLSSKCFKKRVIAFERANKRDNLSKVREILGKNVPALVEGSDHAHGGIESIGTKAKKTYLKIGSFDFDAIKFSLIDKENRVSSSKPKYSRPHISSVTFNSKRLGNRVLHFNPSMNNLIGIRGSGKSSILESIRYGLDITLNKNLKDVTYKEKIVNELLGSGGKMTIEIVDAHGRLFSVEKIYGETTTISCEGVQQQSLQVCALLKQPLYFGQKDLAELGGETSTDDLITRLIGHKTASIKDEIETKKNTALEILKAIEKLNKAIKTKDDLIASQASLRLQLEIFTKYNIEEKLNKQIIFDKDKLYIERLIEFEGKILDDLSSLVTLYKDDFSEKLNYTSSENQLMIDRINASIISFESKFNELSKTIEDLQKLKQNLTSFQSSFSKEYTSCIEEFAEIKREINIPSIDLDSFLRIKTDLEKIDVALEEIIKNAERKSQQSISLQKELTDLKNLWHNEFTIVNKEISKINSSQDAIRIEVEFKNNKDKLVDFIREIVKGSGLQERHIIAITNHYNDLIEIYYDLKKNDSQLTQILSGGETFVKFKNKFIENISECLVFRVPDKYKIYYKNRLLNEHSLGQRASALILFILSLKENDLILIDQPEDDLDNQTIYDDVITEIKRLKNDVQFIFATHNPNIPVLGDCEQVLACEFIRNETADIINTAHGSIDDPQIQNKVISIMEGGEDAFNKRKLIYELWKN